MSAIAVVVRLATLACAIGMPGVRRSSIGRRVIVLGFDGLDFSFTRDLMARGRLPHFAQLAARGSFAPLGTSVPPQSPVAWSSFITGLDPGGHGIFDFIHRDPKTMTPYLSTSKTEAGWPHAVRRQVAAPADPAAASSCCVRARPSGTCSSTVASTRPSSACLRTSRRPGPRRAS